MRLKLSLLLALLNTLATTSIYAAETTNLSLFTASATASLTLQGNGSNDLIFSPSPNTDFVTEGLLAFKNLNNLIFEGRGLTPTLYKSTLGDLSDLVFENINSISFRNIHVNNFAAIIATAKSQSELFLFKNIGNITFDSNGSDFGGGVISTNAGLRFENSSGDIQFTNNFVKRVMYEGGVINAKGKITFINTGKILFEDNYFELGGQEAAINAYDGLDIINTGDVEFLNNSNKQNATGTTKKASLAFTH